MKDRQVGGTNGAEVGLIDHPAILAWRQLGAELGKADRIQVLKERRNSGRCVCRLVGAGPGGCNVIAKRCDSDSAVTEHLIYREALSQLPIGALQCYGVVPDESNEFCWLFLEDAGDAKYSSDLEDHRILAGRWLGAMNTSAQRLSIATRLPNRGPAFYFEKLQVARSATREKLDHPALGSDDRQILNAIVSHCDVLETHWGRIEQFCARMPQTLVHGDLSSWNACIRVNHKGKRLLIMDWEFAGWGVPAADLAQFAVNSLTPDIASYWSVVKECWPHLDPSGLRQLVDLGSVFRWINGVAWTNCGFSERSVDSAQWYVHQMRYYQPRLAEWSLAGGFRFLAGLA
jgi:Phosphotransferase enzyme family